MPRIGRIAPGGMIYHVLNRGNGGRQLFFKDGDYLAFINVIERVREIVPVEVLGYCLMPDHWHLVLRPPSDGDLSSFMLRLTTGHVRRHYANYPDSGGGHLYQGRFKNFPIEEDSHLLTILRFVEASALRAKLVRRAENWKWGSLHARENRLYPEVLSAWPVRRPSNWLKLVNSAIEADELETIQTSVQRGRPYGSPMWVDRIVKRLGLGFTIRPRGRPLKQKPGKSRKL